MAADLLKATRERTQIRRLFSRTASSLDNRLSEPVIDVSAVELEFMYLEEKINRLAALDKFIQNDLLTREEYQEDLLTKEVDEAEKYLSKFIKYRQKYNHLKDLPKETKVTANVCKEDKRNYRLPQIEIKKYDDDPKKWIQFWGQFHKIHEDQSINEEDKFQYLLQCLKEDSDSRALVESYPPSAENYKKAVEQLTNRYGREEMLVEVYIRELLCMVLSQARGELVLDIRALYDKISTYLHALESLGVTKDRYDAMLFLLIESAIPEQILIAWSRSQLQSREQGSERLAQLLKFLCNEVEAEERIRLARSECNISKFPNTDTHSPSRQTDIRPTAACLATKISTEAGKVLCLFCDRDNHTANECGKGGDLTMSEKQELIKKKGGCFICLKKGHMAKQCRMFPKCLLCKRRHFVIMCPDLHKPKDKQEVNKVKNENVSFCQGKLTTLLQTLVAVVEQDGKQKKVRVLLDSGSQRSYIQKNLAEELNLKMVGREELGHTLFGGVEKKPEIYDKCQFKVSSLDNSFVMSLNALAIDNSLCGYLPKVENKKIIKELRNSNIELTDMKSDITDIGLLLGSDYMGAILTGTIVHMENNLCAMKTKLGWTLQGPMAGTYSSTLQSCFSQSNDISDLWSIELLGIKEPHDKNEPEEILKNFNDNISETETGRYEVNLLWKEDIPDLKPNFRNAQRRLQSTTKKLVRTGNLHGYDKVFKEWMDEGIIEEVVDDNTNRGHYLSHHPVIKMSSSTTKIRPVFDASSPDENGWSLNDCMDKGLNLIEFIPRLLISFRKGAYGITSDIRKAFLNISIKEEDRDYLKFLWWKNIDLCEDLVSYRHQRVVFGITCSPFILGAIINHHLDKTEIYKETAQKLKRSFYVDNCVTSVETEDQLEKFISESKELMNMGKFDLRSWVTSPKRIDDTSTLPVLGMIWNTIRDDLQFSVNLKNDITDKITKRQLLSVTQQVFDPLGLVSPVTLIPKLIIQRAWLSNTGWDEEVSVDLKKEFKEWLETLHFINECRFPRRLTGAPIEECETSVHVMADASKHAYAGCIFLRTRHSNRVCVQLIIAKSRVAPTKRIMTLARLELMGVLIASRLFLEVVNSELLSQCKDYKVYCWTDSAVVLAWLKRQRSWKPFVSNRVTEICKNTNREDWFHLPGYANAADLPSRGCDAKTLMNTRWWEGPAWLKLERDEWPKSNITELPIDEENTVCNEEIRRTATNVDTNMSAFSKRLMHFSKYNQIVRLVAWLLRLCPSVRRQFFVRKGNIGNDEYRNAEQVLIRLVQKENFTNKENMPKDLCIITDEDGIMRVKTRLDFSNESKEFISPILLPGKSEIVQRLVLQRHLKLCHAGTGTIMSDLRNTYWILSIRRLAKKIVAECMVCKRFKCKSYNVPEAPLPMDRIELANVFQVTGIDLAGPLYLLNKQKCWIVLFTCATYRAVHLELVESLSTASFIMALRRFLARRGRVNVIYTDNGSNFHGTANLLKNIDWNEIENTTALQSIQWKFIPPGSPWWGGWWERIIRVVKEILRRILGKASVNWIELSTILCDCESIINSRPLTYIAMNDDSLRPLTPQMFLQSMNSSETPDLDRIDAENLGQRYRYLQKLRQNFRQRFKSEYLSLLSSKNYRNIMKEPQVGDVVLIELDTTRLHWPIGIIEEVYVGNDGLTRVAKVRTATGERVRACQKLYPLELSAKSLREGSLNTGKLRLNDKSPADLHVAEPTSSSGDVNPTTTRRGRVIKIPHRYLI